MRSRIWPARISRVLIIEEGATAVEYAVMLALIVGVCLGAIRNMSLATGSSFDRSARAISQALSG